MIWFDHLFIYVSMIGNLCQVNTEIKIAIVCKWQGKCDPP